MKFDMKRIICLAALSIVLASCGGGKNNEGTNVDSATQAVRDSLQQAMADQDSVIALFTELSDAMQQIKAVEGIVSTSDLQNGEIVNQRKRLRDDMTAIQQSIAKNREKLARLEERLAKSNSNNSQLKRAITSLKNQIQAQQLTIRDLREELAAANIIIAELTSAQDSLKETVSQAMAAQEEAEQYALDATNELNRCYYVVGSKKELKDHNIIETGFMKKTKVSPEDYETDYFTAVDKRDFTSLPLHSKKAQVMSGQPKDSYMLETDAHGMKVLKITNPARFWSTSNYLVVKID